MYIVLYVFLAAESMLGFVLPAQSTLGRHQRARACHPGTGVINNELYTGVLIWNRLHFVKDPATGKRVSRANPPAKWIRTEVPHLRMVGDELWQAGKERQKSVASQFEAVAIGTRKARARKQHTMRRPVSLLSGLLTCGRCGGRYVLFTRDRYACLNHQRRGICDNGRTIARKKIEQRVLAGLKERLVSAEAVAEAIRAYAQETNRLNQERRAQGEQDRKALDRSSAPSRASWPRSRMAFANLR